MPQQEAHISNHQMSVTASKEAQAPGSLQHPVPAAAETTQLGSPSGQLRHSSMGLVMLCAASHSNHITRANMQRVSPTRPRRTEAPPTSPTPCHTQQQGRCQLQCTMKAARSATPCKRGSCMTAHTLSCWRTARWSVTAELSSHCPTSARFWTVQKSGRCT